MIKTLWFSSHASSPDSGLQCKLFYAQFQVSTCSEVAIDQIIKVWIHSEDEVRDVQMKCKQINKQRERFTTCLHFTNCTKM